MTGIREVQRPTEPRPSVPQNGSDRSRSNFCPVLFRPSVLDRRAKSAFLNQIGYVIPVLDPVRSSRPGSLREPPASSTKSSGRLSLSSFSMAALLSLPPPHAPLVGRRLVLSEGRVVVFRCSSTSQTPNASGVSVQEPTISLLLRRNAPTAKPPARALSRPRRGNFITESNPITTMMWAVFYQVCVIKIDSGVSKRAEEQKSRRAAVGRGGFKEGSPLFWVLAGGPSKLTGFAWDSWSLVDSIVGEDKAWTKLPLGREERKLRLSSHQTLMRRRLLVSETMESTLTPEKERRGALASTSGTDVAVFFLMNDLRPGTSMKLHFTRTSPVTAFLPRSLAKIIPLSLKKLPEILSVFSIRSNTVEAEVPKKILRECEEPAAIGESRYCATSLESMVDFSTSQLKTRNELAISIEISKEETPMQHYTITLSRGRDLEGEIDENDGRERVLGFLQNSSIFAM